MFIKKLKAFSPILNLLRQGIVIETMKTPNPNFIKFIPIDHKVLGDQGTIDIPSSQYSEISPLAQELFKIEGVTRIFYGSDYISIAKGEQKEWDLLKPEIFRVISNHYDNKLPLLSSSAVLQSQEMDPNDSQTVQFIKQIIASRIRPNVQQDGGDVKFVSFDDQSGVLRIKMVGACAGCPSSAATLKGGIQKMLTYYVKQIKEIIAQDS